MTDKYILGIDTGGTFTDSVVMDFPTKKVLASSKALTTKENLEEGIRASIDGLDFDDLGRLALVSLSTTLATNAIVEGKGCRTGLILIGRNIEEPLPAEEICFIRGNVDIKGRIKQQIREDEVMDAIAKFDGKIEAAAVSCYAGSKNPLLEQKVQALLEKYLNIPVFSAHELSSDLGYVERTVTSLLNARLIKIIRDFLDRTKKALIARNISAPVMIVKGDGGLMDEETARNRPVETILSGPAASTLGAVHLSGLDDAIIIDMGSTTSDIVCIEDGQMKVVENGARVGGWRTRVKAADVCTYGIGGDSLLFLDDSGNLMSGPEKAEPLCVAALKCDGVKAQVKGMGNYEFSEISIYRRGSVDIRRQLNEMEKKILDLIGDDALSQISVNEALNEELQQAGIETESLQDILSGMVKEGFLIKAGLTPTDILHGTGEFIAFDKEAAEEGICVFSERCSLNRDEFITAVKKKVRNNLYSALISSAASFDGCRADMMLSGSSRYLINKSLESSDSEFLRSGFRLNLPIVGAGAPAQAWLPEVAQMLEAELIIPDYSHVNCAVGAGLCKITSYASAVIRPSDRKGFYVLYLPDETVEYEMLEKAEERGIASITNRVRNEIELNGGADTVVKTASKPIYTRFYNAADKVFIELRLSAEASAWPRVVLNGK